MASCRFLHPFLLMKEVCGKTAAGWEYEIRCNAGSESNYTWIFGCCQEGYHGKMDLVMNMSSDKPFYKTLSRKGITEYNLIFKQRFSANTFHRMKKGEAISTKTPDALCYALDCQVEDIIKFEKE